MRVAQFDELRQKPRHYCDKSHANRSQTTGFVDFNKRTSRLAANLPLFRANLCPLTFVDVPAQAYSRATLGVYELTRVELLRDLYVWAYERSTQEYLGAWAAERAEAKIGPSEDSFRRFRRRISGYLPRKRRKMDRCGQFAAGVVSAAQAPSHQAGAGRARPDPVGLSGAHQANHPRRGATP